MKSIGFVGRLLDQLSPGNDKLRVQFDDETVVKQLEAVGIICGSGSVNGASMGTGTQGTGTLAVPGLTPQHVCFVSAQAALSVAVVVTGAACVTPGTLTVYFNNPSAGTLDPAAATFAYFCVPGTLN